MSDQFYKLLRENFKVTDIYEHCFVVTLYWRLPLFRAQAWNRRSTAVASSQHRKTLHLLSTTKPVNSFLSDSPADWTSNGKVSGVVDFSRFITMAYHPYMLPNRVTYKQCHQINVLTPLASFNCTGMAFLGGYFLLQLLQQLLRCALRYTMAHWSWLLLHLCSWSVLQLWL